MQDCHVPKETLSLASNARINERVPWFCIVWCSQLVGQRIGDGQIKLRGNMKSLGGEASSFEIQPTIIRQPI